MNKFVSLFCGNSNPTLGRSVSSYLKIKLGTRTVKHFSDGEIFVKIKEDISGHHVYVMQSMVFPVNENLMEMLILIDALKRASASHITAVVPYLCYSRQDRGFALGEPVTVKLIADLIKTAGVNHLISIDLHSNRISNFFNIPVDNISSISIFLEDIKSKFASKEIVLVSPDIGGKERVILYAKKIGANFAIFNKIRIQHNFVKTMNFTGNVSGKIAIIIDDIVDTANTICEAAKILTKAGAIKVYAYATHAVLSGSAISNIENSHISEMVVSDSLMFKKSNKIRALSCATLIGKAIKKINLR